MRRASIPLLVAALAFATPVAANDSARLKARPVASVLSLPPGKTILRGGGIAYRPASLPPGPRPLLVALHGSGQDPRPFLDFFAAWADRCGAVVLAPVAKKPTWDIIADAHEAKSRITGPARPKAQFGPDARAIDSDLQRLFAAAPVDPARIALLGFSDGASYALSLGLPNPDLFSSLIALSPGFALWPDTVSLSQKIFVAHGTRDSRLSFANARDRIVKPMRDAGMTVEFREFAGDHVMVRSIVHDALESTLGCDRALGISGAAKPPQRG